MRLKLLKGMASLCESLKSYYQYTTNYFLKNLDHKFLKKIFKNLEFQKIEAELIKKKIPYIRTSNFHSEEAL